MSAKILSVDEFCDAIGKLFEQDERTKTRALASVINAYCDAIERVRELEVKLDAS